MTSPLRAIYSKFTRFGKALFRRIGYTIYFLNTNGRLFKNLVFLFVRHPKVFLKNLDKTNIKLFFEQHKTLSTASLEDEVRKKILASLEQPLAIGNASSRHADIFDGFNVSPPSDEKNNLLVIDRFLPAYDKNSGALRMFSILKILNELGFKITFLPDDLGNRDPEPYIAELQAMGVEVLHGNISVESYLRQIGSSFSFVILSEALAAYKYISLIRAYCIHSTVIYDTVDLHWVRTERASALTGDNELHKESVYFKQTELLTASCSDIVFTVTYDEKEILLTEIPELKIHVVPNIHEVVKTGVKPFQARRDIMFIGHYLHKPNEDAVFFFVNEILPMIRKELPGIRFFVAGSNPTEDISRLNSEDIQVTGFVKDVTPYFENCRVFIAPLRFGAGMKGKIGQSMTFGLPVVTTKIGAEGIGLVHGETALIADTPHEFADLVVQLYSNEELWNRISKKSVTHVTENFSPEIMKRKLAEIFTDFPSVSK